MTSCNWTSFKAKYLDPKWQNKLFQEHFFKMSSLKYSMVMKIKSIKTLSKIMQSKRHTSKCKLLCIWYQRGLLAITNLKPLGHVRSARTRETRFSLVIMLEKPEPGISLGYSEGVVAHVLQHINHDSWYTKHLHTFLFCGCTHWLMVVQWIMRQKTLWGCNKCPPNSVLTFVTAEILPHTVILDWTDILF